MIGTILYHAKITDGCVDLSTHTIVEDKKRSDKYDLESDYGSESTCLKSDVGVVVFLTKQEAMDYLIDKLEKSVDMGEKYLKKEKSHLIKAKEFSI